MQDQQVQPRWLDTAQASRDSGLSAKTLRRLIKSGRLPAGKVTESPQGHWRIKREDIEALLGGAE
jgi:excisionase family DNA binding protein